MEKVDDLRRVQRAAKSVNRGRENQVAGHLDRRARGGRLRLHPEPRRNARAERKLAGSSRRGEVDPDIRAFERRNGAPPDEALKLVPHHAVCGNVKQFRAAEKARGGADPPNLKQMRLFEWTSEDIR